MGTISAHALTFLTAGTERARLDTSGNFGLGAAATAVSTFKMVTATGPSTSVGGMFETAVSDRSNIGRFYSTNNGTVLENTGASLLQLSNNGSTRLTIDSTGQVGVGITPSGTQLHVKSGLISIARFETTTARGSGAAVISIDDPTGSKGYFGYGSPNDKLQIYNGLNASLDLYANAALYLSITSDGRIYGTALHNNAGSVTGTGTQYIASGTYTPTITNGTNISASTARKSQWIRVGNVVTASITVTTTQTNISAVTDIGVSLPIASNLAVTYDLSGTGFRYDAAGGGGSTIRVIGDTTNDRASLTWISNTSVNTSDLTATFTYEVL
jgi:hypothetical protein